jgi:hypothetical protein
MIPLLASLVLLGPQQAAPAAPGNSALLDCVAAQAGDAAITLSELNRANDRLLRSQPVSTQEEAQKLAVQGMLELLTARLEAQAGEDMGLDATQISQQIRLTLEEERERVGLAKYTEQLSGEGRDALGAEQDRAEELYRLLWRREKLGYSVAGRRPVVDSYIRPGELRTLFAESRAALSSTRVRLQWLIVTSEAAGSEEEARARCEEARTRVLAGEDLGDLVAEHGVEFRETRGLTPWVRVLGMPDPGLRAFADRAELDELSEVMPLVDRNGVPDPGLGFQLARLHDREAGEELRFEDPELQRRLRILFSNERTRRVLDRERARLRGMAYSWIHPRLRGFSTEPPGEPH